MGGTFRTAGNVHEPEHDGTAEWNSFWDPEAVARVWEANIEIDLVTLESTNQVPLTIDIREQWAKERKYIGIDFLGQCYAIVPSRSLCKELYLLFVGCINCCLCWES